jgi:hypothetical protein
MTESKVNVAGAEAKVKTARPVCPLFKVVLPVLLVTASMFPSPPPPVLYWKPARPPEKAVLVTARLGVVLMPMPLIRVLSVEVLLTDTRS